LQVQPNKTEIEEKWVRGLGTFKAFKDINEFSGKEIQTAFKEQGTRSWHFIKGRFCSMPLLGNPFEYQRLP